MGAAAMAEADRIVQAIWFGVWAGVALVIFFVLTHRGGEGQPTRGQRLWARFAGRYFVTSSDAAEDAAEDEDGVAQHAELAPEKGNGETGENGVAMGKNTINDPFQFPDGFTMLARLVVAEKLGETDALKIAVKASPGKSPRYVEARARLHTALERERPPSGPRFVEYDEDGRPKVDANGKLVTTGRPIPQHEADHPN